VNAAELTCRIRKGKPLAQRDTVFYAASMAAFTSLSFKSFEKSPSRFAFTTLPRISFQAAASAWARSRFVSAKSKTSRFSQGVPVSGQKALRKAWTYTLGNSPSGCSPLTSRRVALPALS
jgi:hypothetical protein